MPLQPQLIRNISPPLLSSSAQPAAQPQSSVHMPGQPSPMSPTSSSPPTVADPMTSSSQSSQELLASSSLSSSSSNIDALKPTVSGRAAGVVLGPTPVDVSFGSSRRAAASSLGHGATPASPDAAPAAAHAAALPIRSPADSTPRQAAARELEVLIRRAYCANPDRAEPILAALRALGGRDEVDRQAP